MQSDAWNGVSRTAPDDNIVDAGGKAAQAIAAMDWSALPIGPIDQWPRALKTLVRMVLNAEQAICIAWGPELRIIYNDAYAQFLGQKAESAMGQPFETVWSDIWTDVLPLIRSALSGKGVRLEDMPLSVTRNAFDEKTWWTFSYTPVHDDAGDIAGFINIATETTQSVQARRVIEEDFADTRSQLVVQQAAERQQRVIQRELAHRLKNTLAMVMAIVSQSVRHATSLADVTESISSRITALAKAQDVMRHTSFASADIRELIEATLAPHVDGTDRVNLFGPALMIESQQALGLSLAIHELATNAAKYGALSTDTGQITVQWSTDGETSFALEWKEQGGPVVALPTRAGFGSRLTGRIVASYFRGSGKTAYEPDGLRYTLTGSLEPASRLGTF